MFKFKPPYIPWFIKNAVYEEYRGRQAINNKIFNDITAEEIANIPFLSEIKKPVFVIWGKKDRVFDVSSVGVFEKQIPNTFSVVLEDTGHAPMMEEPEISASHYLHFLAASNISLWKARSHRPNGHGKRRQYGRKPTQSHE